MLAGMTTCSRWSVQVRLSEEGDFSITGKCIDALCRHPKDGHTRFFPDWQVFFRGKNTFSSPALRTRRQEKYKKREYVQADTTCSAADRMPREDTASGVPGRGPPTKKLRLQQNDGR